MYPVNFGGPGVFYPIPFGLVNRRDYNGNLPDEVKEAIEKRRDEIDSAEDINGIIDEAYMRR